MLATLNILRILLNVNAFHEYISTYYNSKDLTDIFEGYKFVQTEEHYQRVLETDEEDLDAVSGFSNLCRLTHRLEEEKQCIEQVHQQLKKTDSRYPNRSFQ